MLLEPGGCTAFCSHSNSNVLNHPALQEVGLIKVKEALYEMGVPVAYMQLDGNTHATESKR